MKTENKGTLLTMVAFLVALFVLASLLNPAHARQDKAQDKPVPVGRHWKVVPDVAPKNLQEELEKLDKEGYGIPTEGIVPVDGKFTIIVSDNNKEDESDEAEEDHSGR